MRIAWVGLAPTDDVGTSYLATQLLVELGRLGVDCEVFCAAAETSIHPRVRASDDLRLFCLPSGWEPDRWYNRTPLSHHLSLMFARIRAQGRLAQTMVWRHAEHPYDLVYQWSQIELFNLRRLRHQLPPIILHPNAHAAGELRWHRRERALARGGESLARYATVDAMLMARAAMQRRDVRLARAIISPSQRYRELLCSDYSVPPERVYVVPNPLDLQRFSADGRTRRSGPLTLLFVSRIAVRKGVEMIVELSHRLADLAGVVRIDVVGPGDTWSDYRHLLADLDPRVASYLGPLPVTEVAERYREIDLVLVPSQYDPAPSVVREALACGVPVVASSEVGSAEGIDPKVCAVFPAGDADAFEAATRSLIGRLRDGEGRALASVARAEVDPRFGGATVAAQVLDVLERTANEPVS